MYAHCNNTIATISTSEGIVVEPTAVVSPTVVGQTLALAAGQSNRGMSGIQHGEVQAIDTIVMLHCLQRIIVDAGVVERLAMPPERCLGGTKQFPFFKEILRIYSQRETDNTIAARYCLERIVVDSGSVQGLGDTFFCPYIRMLRAGLSSFVNQVLVAPLIIYNQYAITEINRLQGIVVDARASINLIAVSDGVVFASREYQTLFIRREDSQFQSVDTIKTGLSLQRVEIGTRLVQASICVMPLPYIGQL